MKDGELIEKALTESIIGSFYEVYNELDFGFLEKTYVRALTVELRSRGHTVDREFSVGVEYKGQVISKQRLDLVVDKKVIVEAKSSAELPLVAKRQLRSYLKSTKLEVGMLLHFGVEAKFYRLVATNKNH